MTSGVSMMEIFEVTHSVELIESIFGKYADDSFSSTPMLWDNINLSDSDCGSNSNSRSLDSS